jgi:hypothetical protein
VTEGLTEDQVAAGLRQVYADIDRIFDRLDRLASAAPEPGSSLAGDDKAASPYHLSHGVLSAASAAAEHLHAVRVLINEAKVLHPTAPFTLLHGAIETASAGVWLLSTPTRATRVARRLGQVAKDAKDADTATRGMGLTTARPRRLGSLILLP